MLSSNKDQVASKLALKPTPPSWSSPGSSSQAPQNSEPKAGCPLARVPVQASVSYVAECSSTMIGLSSAPEVRASQSWATTRPLTRT